MDRLLLSRRHSLLGCRHGSELYRHDCRRRNIRYIGVLGKGSAAFLLLRDIPRHLWRYSGSGSKICLQQFRHWTYCCQWISCYEDCNHEWIQFLEYFPSSDSWKKCPICIRVLEVHYQVKTTAVHKVYNTYCRYILNFFALEYFIFDANMALNGIKLYR